MNKLYIYVDETGDLGFSNNSSILYGVSLVLLETKNDIKGELKNFNNRLDRLNYHNMIHMANLVNNRDEYKYISFKIRKSIFNAIYQFTKKLPIKYKTIIINKKYVNNKIKLNKRLTEEIILFVNNNQDYFNKFKKIILYYDNGQKKLANILDNIFSIYNYEHIIDFNHIEERLFQVADMLTYLDKYFIVILIIKLI